MCPYTYYSLDWNLEGMQFKGIKGNKMILRDRKSVV